ncbi:hypothetical protein BJ322DRAFT_256213 [Thelephora terrestris]|uniref:Uncharacterized protein n=1 Tax=Thelephora terrestris TaxID=56493 RepID=A0A9P6H9M1_9AGAM|nr:hypothetical protein BJ322DRAFT_256213 [Thelephora terrestris]
MSQPGVVLRISTTPSPWPVSTLPTMILVSRPPTTPTPSPIHTLDDDLVAFLESPYVDNAAVAAGLPVATTTANNPETRDRLLAYACVMYDAFVTCQLPSQSIPSEHASLLLPLLELLHGCHPYNSPIALLLGCVYHHHNLYQRSLQMNRHILQYDPQNVSAMCNLGVVLWLMEFPVDAFQCWWKALQLSPTNWDILDNMLEVLLGSKDLNDISPVEPEDPSAPHVLQVRRQALQLCSFVVGHLPERPIRMEEVHRAQDTFCLRVILLRSFQEAGEWEDLVEGIETGVNTTLAPPAGSALQKKTTLDDLLFQVHCVGNLFCGVLNTAADKQDGFDVPQPSPELPGRKILEPTNLLFPVEALRLPLALWPSTNGNLPGIAVPAAPEGSRGDIRMALLKDSTNAATSRLLRTWATRVQELLETQPSSSEGQFAPVGVPCSIYQATRYLVILASYLALSLRPTAMSYNDLGILLSSLGSEHRVSQPDSAGETTGHKLSRLYFEAGLAADPHNVYLMANLGSYWKRERNYEEAIRFVSQALRASLITSSHRCTRYYNLALAENPEFVPARACLKQILKEIEPDFEGVRDEPVYQKFG